MNVLVVTNGHGEDQLAVCLVDAMRERWPSVTIEGIPLVGQGLRLKAAGIAVPGPRVDVPSGGLVRPQWDAVMKDLRAGLLRQFRRQMAFVRSRRHAVDRVIAVGDVLAGWVAGRSVPDKPLVFVPTAKSEYIDGHSRLEAWWMRRCCQHVFPRDERTAAALRRAGVTATWVGNLMMDAMTMTGEPIVDDAGGPVIALLPGSRDDAYVNLSSLAAVLERVADSTGDSVGRGAADVPSGDGPVGLVPVAPGLDIGRAASVLKDRGWTMTEPEQGMLRKGAASIQLLTDVFGDVLAAADVVVGLAGTANEQAAGLGKPVVAFPGPGVQFGPRFLRAQRLLLGDALAVAPPSPEAVAAEVRSILADAARRERMAGVGRERMGPPGAAHRMAEAIGRLWNFKD